MRAAALVLAAALGTANHGCAFGDGDAFGVVEASLDASYAPTPERAVGGGFETTSADYEVRFDELVVVADTLSLVASAANTAGTTFDPQNPPAGYDLCHNGHCHASDGSLVSYEEVEAALAGADAADTGPTYALSGGAIPTTTAGVLAFTCDGPCVMEPGVLRVARLTLLEVHVAGEVRDRRQGDLQRFEGTRRFAGTISLVEPGESGAPLGVLERAVDLAVDEAQPKHLRLALFLPTTVAWFDGADFADALQDDGSIDLDSAAADEVRLEIAGNIAELAFELEVQRFE